MGFYRVARSISRLFPAGLRQRVSKGWIGQRLRNAAPHDDIYDESYYQTMIDETAAQSAPLMARSLIEAIHPRSVIDVGCGTGQLLLEFRNAGIGARGLEFSQAALKICRQRGLDVLQFDIENDPPPQDWRSDIVISTEVAEHLPRRCADRFVELLCKLGSTVFITAAVPGQRGTDHVNEQPNSYWIAKLASRGFAYDDVTSMAWRTQWCQKGVAAWYCASAMLFRRRASQ